MEVEFAVSENSNMENLPVRDCQAGGTLEMENCLEPLERNQNIDSPALIQPVQGSQETRHSPGKENQLEKPHNPKPRASKQATKKQSLQPTPEKRKLSDTKLSQNGETNKKAKFEEKKWDVHANTNSSVITFNYKSKANERSVEKDQPVIIYAKKSVDSENIILYSNKLKGTINPSVPCRALGEGEKIKIITRKQSKTIQSLPDSNYEVYGEGHFFKVQCKGYTEGGAPKKILCDSKYNWKGKPLAVYGRADQTIEEAIQNDKRFNINTEFSLKNPNKTALHERDIKLSFLDSNVVYTVQVTNNKKPNRKPKIQNNRGIQSSDRKAKNSQKATEIKTEFPQTSSVSQSDPNVQTREMPQIYQTLLSTKFSSGFDDLCEKFGRMELRRSIINDHIRYKKPMQADTLKRLNQNLKSVTLIHHTFGTGTFFLLTGNLGLTCFHVLKRFVGSEEECKMKPSLLIPVIFNYDNDSDEKMECRAILECCSEKYDFAFLRILECQSEKGLLQYVAPPPQEGALSIIGHPGGSSKKIDPICSVINFSKRAEEIAATILSDKSYIHVITEHNFMLMSQPELVTYDTCLYKGASGSPVFDDQGNLVAMHTGGYLARTDLAKKSIIEYGRNIIDILICGAIQLEELILWFREVETQKTPLTTYLNKYVGQGVHSVEMQPVIREFLTCFEKNKLPQGLNSDLDDSGIAESPMDTSA